MPLKQGGGGLRACCIIPSRVTVPDLAACLSHGSARKFSTVSVRPMPGSWLLAKGRPREVIERGPRSSAADGGRGGGTGPYDGSTYALRRASCGSKPGLREASPRPSRNLRATGQKNADCERGKCGMARLQFKLARAGMWFPPVVALPEAAGRCCTQRSSACRMTNASVPGA